jgi:hypothetical protein
MPGGSSGRSGLGVCLAVFHIRRTPAQSPARHMIRPLMATFRALILMTISS